MAWRGPSPYAESANIPDVFLVPFKRATDELSDFQAALHLHGGEATHLDPTLGLPKKRKGKLLAQLEGYVPGLKRGEEPKKHLDRPEGMADIPMDPLPPRAGTRPQWGPLGPRRTGPGTMPPRAGTAPRRGRAAGPRAGAILRLRLSGLIPAAPAPLAPGAPQVHTVTDGDNDGDIDQDDYDASMVTPGEVDKTMKDLRKVLGGTFGTKERIAARQMASLLTYDDADFRGVISHVSIGAKPVELASDLPGPEKDKLAKKITAITLRFVRNYNQKMRRKFFHGRAVKAAKAGRAAVVGRFREPRKERKARLAHAKAEEKRQRKLLEREAPPRAGSAPPALPGFDRASGSLRRVNQYFDSVGHDNVIRTEARVPRADLTKQIHIEGLGKRLYRTFYDITDEDFDDTREEMLDFFQERFGLPFKAAGVSMNEEEERKGTLHLYHKDSKEPFATLKNYLLNPELETSVSAASSGLGSGIKDSVVSEAGWMVIVNEEKGVYIKGEYGGDSEKIAPKGSKLVYYDMHIASKEAGDAGVGSGISIHLESSRPSYTIPGTSDEVMPLVASRCCTDGNTLAISMDKSAEREILDEDGFVHIRTRIDI